MARKTKTAPLQPGRVPFDREARDALRRVPVPLYDVEASLTPAERGTARGRSRVERRHAFVLLEGRSRNPFAPNVRRVRLPRSMRVPGAMLPATRADLDLARAALAGAGR